MTSFQPFLQALRQGFINRSGMYRSGASANSAKQRSICTDMTTKSSAEGTTPKALGAQANRMMRKRKTIEEWDYTVIQMASASAWH